jgi:hypothetical protein
MIHHPYPKEDTIPMFNDPSDLVPKPFGLRDLSMVENWPELKEKLRSDLTQAHWNRLDGFAKQLEQIRAL